MAASTSRDPASRLRRAVQADNLPLVRRLSRQVDIRNPDANRYTSLSWAAICGNEEMFDWLINEGGHDDEELSRDSESSTLLHLLASLPSNTLTPPNKRETYLSSGVSIRMAGLYFEKFPFLIDWSNAGGKTALHVAAEVGNEGFVRLLGDLGADSDLPDLQGNTPLHYASAWGHLPVVQLLIEMGCQFGARNNEGFTASDFAFSYSIQNSLQEFARSQMVARKALKRSGTGGSATPQPPPSSVSVSNSGQGGFASGNETEESSGFG